MNAQADPPIDPAILREAADWLSRLHAGDASSDDNHSLVFHRVTV